MKRVLFAFTLAVMAAFCASAEVGDMAAGLDFNYATKGGFMGLGAKYEVEVAKNLRFAPEFIYYFEDDHESAMNVNLNLQYMIQSGGGTVIYPIAGFSYMSYRLSDNYYYDDTDDNKKDLCGAMLGIGFEYRINENFRFFTEERFQIQKDRNQAVTTMGIKYCFSLGEY